MVEIDFARRSMNFSFVRQITLIGLYATLWGCAASRPPATAVGSAPPKPAAPVVVVPAGVDSSVAVSATLAAQQVLVGVTEDSLARSYFQQSQLLLEQGRPLKEAFKQSRSQKQTVAPADTARAFELGVSGEDQLAKGDKALGGKRIGEMTLEELKRSPEATRRAAADDYEQARDLLERSLQLNPWDPYTRDNLIGVYRDLADLHYSLDALDETITAIDKYVALYGDDWGYLKSAAECHLLKGDTLHALIAYRRAEDALLVWAGIPDHPDQVVAPDRLDSAQHAAWLSLISWQYFCEKALRESNSAVADLHRLAGSCILPADSATRLGADDELRSLQWDNGDIDAMARWAAIVQQTRDNEWEDARAALLELRPLLDNPDAKFDADFLAATIDFRYLDQHDRGLTGLRQLLSARGFSEVDSSLDSLLAHSGPSGFVSRMNSQRQAAPPRLTELLDYYGSACTSFGREIEDKRQDRERAYVYYYQGALIPWNRQAVSLFNLAYLSRNQPDRAILFGQLALEPGFAEPLDTESRRLVYQLLLDAFRRKNDRARAQYYYQALLAEQPAEAK
jgi:hypothetical protein